MDRFLREGSSPLPSSKTIPRSASYFNAIQQTVTPPIDPISIIQLSFAEEPEPDFLYCPHHPRNVSWWWKDRCIVCREIHETPSGSAPSTEVYTGVDSGRLKYIQDTRSKMAYNPLDYHPDYRFSRWPYISANSVLTWRLPPAEETTSNVGDINFTKRERRHMKAEKKYPQRMPRKGSDTNPSTFTGKVLLIRKEGLSTIGRALEGSKTTNASGQSWKC
jgi:hypothetical protein